jgi:HSP20 family molecular chaperone IbpA
MFDGLERVKQWLQSGDQFFQQVNALWNSGPRVDVFDVGGKVKVIIEAPGLMNAAGRHEWAVRVIEQSLMLRGLLQIEESARSDYGRTYSERREEHFTKIIPLPVPVESKPASVRYADGLVTVLLNKRQDGSGDEWHRIDFGRKK